MDAVVKGNEGFCAGDSRNCLDFAIEQLHEMLIVAGKKLDEHGVGAGGEVAFHNFRYFLKFGNHLVVHGTALKIHTYECAGAITEELCTHVVTGTGDDTEIHHALYALMNGSTRYATFGGYFFGGYAGIVHDNAEYLFVKFIYLSHSSCSVRCDKIREFFSKNMQNDSGYEQNYWEIYKKGRHNAF